MKKIDLHIHTKSTISDPEFNFSLDKLKEYVKTLEINCIAITNHNLFDLKQFQLISRSLGICTLPGIEINLEGGHLLLISKNTELEDFDSKCKQVEDLITNSDDFILIAKLEEIFIDMSQYLLIPHHDKKPKIKQDIIKALGKFISAGEVMSPKKFIYSKKNTADLVPVLFSDLRFYDEMGDFPTRQTFVDVKNLDFSNIKIALLDRGKVFLSKRGNNTFQVFTDGQELSNGLNLVLGKRSSGKTVMLNKIERAYDNVKYIKQFELLGKEEKRDEKEFNRKVENKRSDVAEEYLKEFKEVVEDISNIDRKGNDGNLERYVSSLLSFASDEEIKDIFSNTLLYSESPYDILENNNLESLISSVEKLIVNIEERNIIDKYITKDKLRKLIVELILKYNELKELKLKKEYINSLIQNIQGELKTETATPQIDDISFYEFILDREKIIKFDKVVSSIKKGNLISHGEVGKFKIITQIKKYKNATEIGNRVGRKNKFVDAFKKYDKPIDFLEHLKTLTSLNNTEYYKCFVNIEYRILNEYSLDVSGGERSEFNLLETIRDARNYDLLLIDEPESSFDNMFLKDEINKQIKEISNDMPVVITTHNSTVGALIQPEYIIYTERDIGSGSPSFKVFSGAFTDRKLKNVDGEEINSRDIMLTCLEAGEEAYNNKNTIYENIKN